MDSGFASVGGECNIDTILSLSETPLKIQERLCIYVFISNIVSYKDRENRKVTRATQVRQIGSRWISDN